MKTKHHPIVACSPFSRRAKAHLWVPADNRRIPDLMRSLCGSVYDPHHTLLPAGSGVVTCLHCKRIADNEREIVTMSEHSAESVNHGWVIEGAWSETSRPDYWVGSSTWSTDHRKALRFAREQDAQQAADLMLDGINYRICEHQWAEVRTAVNETGTRNG